MGKAWRMGLVALVVFAMVWLVSMWRWQTQAVDVQASDLALHLLALPLGLLCVGWISLKLADRVRQGATAAPPPAPDAAALKAASKSTGDASTEGNARSPLAPFGVKQAVFCLPAGDEAHDLLAKIAAHQARPDLDPELVDMDGAAVFSARIAAVDEALSEGLRPDEPTWTLRMHRAELLLIRTWSALAEALTDSLPAARAAGTWDTHAANDELSRPEGPAHLAGVASISSKARPILPRLDVWVVTPADWLESTQHAWMRRAQECALHTHPNCEVHWHLCPVHHPDDIWGHLRGAAAVSAHHLGPRSVVLLAADSLIDESIVDLWQSRGELFTSFHQSGRVPGEGAVALWLSTADWPAAQPEGIPSEALPGLALAEPNQAQRSHSADVRGRVGTEALKACLLAAWTQPSPPTWVWSDADHRASRASELFESLQDTWSELDLATQVIRLGDACGDLGLVRPLAPLAVAVALGEPALVALVHDPVRRAVVSIKPLVESEVVK